MNRSRAKRTRREIMRHFVLGFAAICMLYPLLWMIMSSF
jgi:ABC-type glycerol-3-phosphate transport system permease component